MLLFLFTIVTGCTNYRNGPPHVYGTAQ